MDKRSNTAIWVKMSNMTMKMRTVVENAPAELCITFKGAPLEMCARSQNTFRSVKHPQRLWYTLKCMWNILNVTPLKHLSFLLCTSIRITSKCENNFKRVQIFDKLSHPSLITDCIVCYEILLSVWSTYYQGSYYTIINCVIQINIACGGVEGGHSYSLADWPK